MKHNNTPIRGRVIGVLGTIFILGANLCQSQTPFQVAGTLNRNFNPSGLMVTANGSRVTGTDFFSGSLVVDLGGNERGAAVAINQNNGKIVTAFRTNTGPQHTRERCALTVTNQDGTLDLTFNPSGLWIDSLGNFVTGGYSGTLIINQINPPLAGRIGECDVAINQSNGNIVLVSDRIFNTSTFANILVAVIKPDGTLDRTFNPSGLRINDDGTVSPGVTYSGSLEVDFSRRGDFGPVVAIDEARQKIVVAFLAEQQPNNSIFDLGIIVVNPTGIDPLDREFNPSGLVITSTGSPTTGAYSGGLRVDLGGNIRDPAVDIHQESGKIIVALDLNTGPGVFNNLGTVVANPTGRILLDQTFNPSGLSIESNGVLTDLGGYSGTLIADLGGSESSASVLVDQETGKIFVAAVTTTGPGTPATQLGVIAFTPTGLLNGLFNPLGVAVEDDGTLSPGGITGILLASLGGDLLVVNSVDSAEQENKIRVAGLLGPAGLTREVTVITINMLGNEVIDRTFNPEALFFSLSGVEVSGGMVYSGMVKGEIAERSSFVSIATYQMTGPIIVAVQRGDLPSSAPDSQLFSFHSTTRLPPPPPLPPISELFQFGYIPMAAI